MSQREYKSDRSLFFVRVLAVIGAINCAVVPLFFVQQRPLFPFPGLYLMEIAGLGILGLAGLVLVEPYSPFGRTVPWVAAGVLLAFVVLAGFSFGFFLTPAVVAFLLAGFLWRRTVDESVSKFIGLFLIAAILQTILIVMFAQMA